VNDLFLLLRYVDIHYLFDMKVMIAFLSLYCRNIYLNFSCHGHRHVDDTFDWSMHNLLLWNDNGYMHNLFLLVRHMNVDMLLHMEMMRALFPLDRGYMHNLLNHHGNWHLYILLYVAMLNSRLRDNLRNMYNLMHIPGQNFWNLVYFLHDLSCWNFYNVLVHLPWVVRVIFLMNVLRWGINLVAVASGILGSTIFPGMLK
jgi:hypothetical protein